MKNLNSLQVQKFSKQLSFYNNERRKYIYPGSFIRTVGIDMKKTYEILTQIENLGFIERQYEVYCPSCKYSTGEIYSSLNDLPITHSCDNCDNDFDSFENVIVIYRVLVV